MFVSSYQITSLDLASVLILIPLNMMHCNCIAHARACIVCVCVCSCLLFRHLPPTFGNLRWVVSNFRSPFLGIDEIFLNKGKSGWFITP